MTGHVSFLFALLAALGCGMAMFFVGYWIGHRDAAGSGA